jgi:hypothetical protein
MEITSNAGIAGIFAMRCVLVALYSAALFAFASEAWDCVRSRKDPGDVLAGGLWLITAGALFANLNSLWIMLSEFGMFHGSLLTAYMAQAGLMAGYFLILNAWLGATSAKPFSKVAAYSAAVLAGVAMVAFSGFLLALAFLV